MPPPERDSNGTRALVWFKRNLAALGLPLLPRTGPLPQVLHELRREFAFTHLLSHEVTGPGWSFTRDLAVAAMPGVD